MPTDQNSFIKADLLWDWIPDHEIFNIKIVEREKGQIKYNAELGMDDATWIDLPESSEHIYNFDVSKRGEYLGMPEIEDTLLAGYRDANIAHKQMSP